MPVQIATLKNNRNSRDLLNLQYLEPSRFINTIKERGEYTCVICGRKSFRKIQLNHKVYCNKHYKQIRKYGKVLDHNPRTRADKNEIRVIGNLAFMDLYDNQSNVIATTVFDADMVGKVRYTKWRLSHGYVMNSPKFHASTKHLSRVILNTDQFVDHINHDTLDNRRCNLRIVTKSENAMNQKEVKGVHETKGGKFYAHIKLHQKMINLGVYVDKEEAYFARWYAEKLIFKEFAYQKEKPVILSQREEEIKTYVKRKVQRL